MLPTPRYLVVAKIVAPFGARGEVKAEVWTDHPDRLAERTTVFLGGEDEEPRAYALRGVRFHQKRALLSFVGYDDRTAAESLRGLLVQVPSSEVPPPPPGSFYVHQIIGLEAWGTDGVLLGKVVAVITTGSNDVYTVQGGKGEILVPAVPHFVREVDLEHGRLIVEAAGL